MQAKIHDDDGRALDATVTLEVVGRECGIIFESQGPGRNTDYASGFRTVIKRLQTASATITGAEVCSREVQGLPAELRRISIPDCTIPLRLTQNLNGEKLANEIRKAAAAVAREPEARGPGNSTRRVRLQVSLSSRGIRTIDRVLDAVIAPTNSSTATTAASEHLGNPPLFCGQGFELPVAARRAVELRAMAVAQEHLAAAWPSVTDVSATESYDLRCERGEATLFVEVKGTTGTGTAILLTANEVALATREAPHTALLVVHSIEISEGPTGWRAEGGELRVTQPWEPQSSQLTPLTFRCVLASHG
jgi:hypothetical protein